jgi:hypothetical protein
MINALSEISLTGYMNGGYQQVKMVALENQYSARNRITCTTLLLEVGTTPNDFANHFLFDKSPRPDLNLVIKYCQYKSSMNSLWIWYARLLRRTGTDSASTSIWINILITEILAKISPDGTNPHAYNPSRPPNNGIQK